MINPYFPECREDERDHPPRIPLLTVPGSLNSVCRRIRVSCQKVATREFDKIKVREDGLVQPYKGII